MKRRALLLALGPTLARSAAPVRLVISDEVIEGQGLYTDFYGALGRALLSGPGLELRQQTCPVRRCLRHLEEGEADLMFGLQRNAERERFLHFLQTPYRQHSADKVFYRRRGQDLARYEDLAGLRIGVKSGSAYFERFDQDATLRRDFGPSHVANLRKLAVGHVDVVPMAEDLGEVLRHRLGLQDRIQAGSLRIKDPSGRSPVISKRSPLMARLPELERAMQGLQDSGQVRVLYEKHFLQRWGLPPGALAAP